MKIFLLSLMITLTASLSIIAQRVEQKHQTPTLHTIETVTLSPSYSCRKDTTVSGYGDTALFLSPYAKQRNSPDLLFNGACGSVDYFQASGGGADMSLIADLGENVPLADLSVSRAFNLRRVHSFPDYSKFVSKVPVQGNHTYAAVISGSDRRGLLVFTVVSYVPNQKAELKYAVKAYEIFPRNDNISEGFSWEAGNQ